MPTQLHIRRDDEAPVVIDVNEDEMVQVHLDTHPRARSGELPSPTFTISGLRWRDGHHFHLGWLQQPVALGTKLRIEYLAGAETASPLAKDVEYIAPEPSCNFCGKPSSEVEVLIKRRHIHYICDGCVRECQEHIDDWKRERAR